MADPGWSVRGGVEAKIGRKGADFARFWPILEGQCLGQCPHAPLLDPPLGTTRKVERGFSPSTSGSTDSDQTAPKSDCSNVYVLDHILKNMQPIELGFVGTSL